MGSVELMIDSGAFSAWNSGRKVSVEEYSNFLSQLKNLSGSFIPINLDEIPSYPGGTPTPKEVQDSAKKSWENLKYLEEAGFSPMPVFHQGEPIEWLLRMIEEGYEYIGIGNIAMASGKDRVEWLDWVFSFLVDEEGRPLVKTHGFGMTSVQLIARYPWHSVDSISYNILAANGSILLPLSKFGGVGDHYQWGDAATVLRISSKSKKVSVPMGHYSNMPKSLRMKFDSYFNLLGFSAGRLADSSQERIRLNVKLYSIIQKEANLQERTFQSNHKGLFLERKPKFDLKKKWDGKEFKMFYGINLHSELNSTLSKEKCSHRLMSYILFVEKSRRSAYWKRIQKIENIASSGYTIKINGGEE